MNLNNIISPIVKQLMLGLLLFIDAGFAFTCLAQTNLPAIYTLSAHQTSAEDYLIHVSLLDIDHYNLNDEPHAQVISPEMLDIKREDNDYKDVYYTPVMSVKGEQRAQLFASADISETDTLFLFSFAKDSVCRVPVKDLEPIGVVSPYADMAPYQPYDFMVGLKLNDKLLQFLQNTKSLSLVCIGKENPFQTGHRKRLVFIPIDSNDCPPLSSGMSSKTKQHQGDILYASWRDHQVFVRYNMVGGERSGHELIVRNAKTGKQLFSHSLVGSEGINPVPLEIMGKEGVYGSAQWIGQVLKGQAVHLSGFEWLSFGCPPLYFMDDENTTIYLRCDNRH